MNSLRVVNCFIHCSLLSYMIRMIFIFTNFVKKILSKVLKNQLIFFWCAGMRFFLHACVYYTKVF